MVINYFRVALRNLLKNKVYSILNISGLAIGLTAFLLIFHYVQYERSYDQNIPDVASVYRVPLEMRHNGETMMSSAENYPGVGPAMLEEIPGVESYARLYNMGYKNNVVISYEQAAGGPVEFKHRRFLYADSSFLSLFGYELLQGNTKTALANPFSAVISDEYARMYFGEEDPIGKTLHLKDDDFNDEVCKITGVFRSLAGNTHLKFDVLFSYKTLFARGDWAPGRYGESWQRKDMYTYVKLAPEVDPTQVENQLASLIQKYKPDLQENNREDIMYLQPVQDIHLQSNLTDEPEIHGSSDSVNALFIIGIFILVIAWVNYINLSTAKAVERAKEVGVRKTLGAFKAQLTSQFFIEALILNGASVILALIISMSVLPFFNNLTELSFAIPDLFTGSSFILLIVLWIVGSLLSGAYPSLVLASFKPLSVLKGKLTSRKSGIILRKGLVIFQFVTSVAMISGTLIVYDQLNFMLSKDLGMNIDQVLVIERPGVAPRDREAFNSAIDVFRSSLTKSPNINGISTSVTIPGKTREYKSGVKPYGASDDEFVVLRWNSMDYDFIDVFQMKLLAGRGFSEKFPNDPDTSVVLSRSAAEQLGFDSPEDAIGQTLEIPSFGFTPIVVGVVNDYHQESLQQTVDPMIFYCTLYGGEFYSLSVSPNNLDETISHVEDSWKQAFPGNPFSYFFLDEYFNQQYKNERKFQNLFGSFAILAIFVGCLGLFGLSAYTAEQRTKEIGVRKVLGSSVYQIFSLLSKSYLSLILIAIVIAVPLSYLAMTEWLNSFAYRHSISILVFFVAAAAVVLISLFTISFQTLKAANVNPIDSLRYE